MWPRGERQHYHWQASVIACPSQHTALSCFPGTDLYQRQHWCAFSVTSVLQQQIESLFSKEWQGDKQYCKRSHASLFLLLSYCPHGLVWCPHKVTQAALGIPTPRASKAEAEATVPWNWRLYHGEISLPSLTHSSATGANSVLALLSSDWRSLISWVTCFSRNICSCLGSEEGEAAISAHGHISLD